MYDQVLTKDIKERFMKVVNKYGAQEACQHLGMPVEEMAAVLSRRKQLILSLKQLKQLGVTQVTHLYATRDWQP